MLALIVVVALLTIAGTAQAECDVGKNDVGLAFVFPEQDCTHNVHADLRYGLYKASHTPFWQTQISGELGWLERVGDTRVQIGPVIALGGSGQKHDWSEAFDEFYVSPRVRARMWMVDEWLTFEGALGPTILWSQEPRGDWTTRTGGYVEVGPTVHGMVGFYVGTGYTPPGGGELGEWRTTFGIRMTLTAAAVVAATAGIIAACDHGGGCW